MTRQEIEQSDLEVLTCENISGVLHMNPTTIRTAAQQMPDMLQFPVIVALSRVKIPRIPFMRFMGWI